MAKLNEEEKARRALNRRRKAALQAEEDAVRNEEKKREWDENGTRLTWDEYVAGASCRGCGLPVNDERESWPYLIMMDDQQREEYEAAEADFRRRHPDCRRFRWTVGRWNHCGFCCPQLPLSPERVASISAFFATWKRPDPGQLAMWQLTLTCDHVIEKTQHHSHEYFSATVANCPDCQRVRGIVTTQRLPAISALRVADQRRKTDELAKARAEHERLQNKADAALRRVTKLEGQLADLDKAQ